MTAAGLFCLSDLGAGTDADAARGLAQLDPASVRDAYGTLWVVEALHRHGGEDWPKWSEKVCGVLISRQEANGSWPATGDTYGSSGGRLLVSALSVLALEVYYRDDLLFASAFYGFLKESEAEATWSDLGAGDPVKSRRAVWTLAGSAKQALPLIDEALKPTRRPAADPKQVARLIAELDDDTFEAREKASAALAKLGGEAVPAMRAALKDTASAEARRRLEALLARLDGAGGTPEQRRALRAVEVLEQVGTPEARQILKRLTKESADTAVVREAEAALRRLAEPAAPRP
jgi:hypothetical protein